MISVGEGKIPWVFTHEQRELVDLRCRRVVMPHNSHAWCTTEEGILKNTQTCWRMVSKILVFFMLPVLFRGTVDLHKPLTKLNHALRLLLGRVVSEKFQFQKRMVDTFPPYLGSRFEIGASIDSGEPVRVRESYSA